MASHLFFQTQTQSWLLPQLLTPTRKRSKLHCQASTGPNIDSSDRSLIVPVRLQLRALIAPSKYCISYNRASNLGAQHMVQVTGCLKVCHRRFQSATMYDFKLGRRGPVRDLSLLRTNLENPPRHKLAMMRLALQLKFELSFLPCG